MRKFCLALLISLVTIPAMADNWIKFKAQAVEDVINTIVAKENRQAAADEYQKQMDQTTGKISVMGIYKVCAAAGKDIRTNNGYSECRYFINQIADKSGFGTKSATQANCANSFNGIWSLSSDGKQYQCVGKDGFKLVYKKSCDGAGGDCVKDFAGLKTQGPVGREFIAEYAKKKNLQLTCYIGFETRRTITSPLGQDYIRCSAGGKAYEFEFDSLNETPGKTSVESENKTMCEFFGGKIVKHPDSSIEKVWQSCDIDSSICNGKIHNLALRIGHTNQYQGYCRLSRKAQTNSTVFLNQIDGVDSYVFYKSGAQMRADMAKVQLEEYLQNTFPRETFIVCDPTVKPLEGNGFGLDVDYLLTCTVGSKQVDFVFDDLTESSKKRADTGMDAMQCITNGGTFKGESCRGPTKEECTKLDAVLRAKGSTEGAKWDNNVRACILGNAMKTYKQDVATNYVVGAVVIVGGAIVTIGTGGAAVPVIVGGAEMLVTDLAINYAIDANHRRLSKQAASRYLDFVTDASECKDEPCALKVLKKHYATLSGVMNDLNKDDQAVVDYEMDKLIGLIKTEYVACGKNDKEQIVFATAAECAMKKSTLRAIDYIDKVSEPVLIIASVAYNPGYVTARFTKLKKLSKIAKVDDVMDVAHMSTTDRKFFEAYKKYGKRGQTPEEFKAMFGGDYAKLEDAIKTGKWKSWDDAATWQREENELKEFFAQHNDAWWMINEEDNLEGAIAKYPQLKKYNQEHFEAFVKAPDPSLNYVTIDKTAREQTERVKKALNRTEIKQEAIDRNAVWKNIDETVKEEYYSGKIRIDEVNSRWEELARAQGTSSKAVDDYVDGVSGEIKRIFNEDIIPTKVKLDNKDFVVAERIQLYSEIVDKDPELRRMATRFDKLTDEEKLAFGQKIMNKSGDYTTSGRYQLKSTAQWDAANPTKAKDRDWVGLHDSYNKTLYIDMQEDGSSLSKFMNTLAHEDGHKVDRVMPEMGMLGKDKFELSDAAYSAQTKYGYRSTLKEQSSYAIGDAVGDDFQRLQDYRFTTANKFGKSDANYIDNIAAEAAATMAVGIGTADALE